jgi:Fe2+ or Zn2+ uptake regulation protein
LKNDPIDVVTVYRTIELFLKADIVREVNLKGENARYELTDLEHDHHHIVCTGCHRLEDFVGCDSLKVERQALRGSKNFATITGHSFDLYGLCNTCAKK